MRASVPDALLGLADPSAFPRQSASGRTHSDPIAGVESAHTWDHLTGRSTEGEASSTHETTRACNQRQTISSVNSRTHSSSWCARNATSRDVQSDRKRHNAAMSCVDATKTRFMCTTNLFAFGKCLKLHWLDLVGSTARFECSEMVGIFCKSSFDLSSCSLRGSSVPAFLHILLSQRVSLHAKSKGGLSSLRAVDHRRGSRLVVQVAGAALICLACMQANSKFSNA